MPRSGLKEMRAHTGPCALPCQYLAASPRISSIRPAHSSISSSVSRFSRAASSILSSSLQTRGRSFCSATSFLRSISVRSLTCYLLELGAVERLGEEDLGAVWGRVHVVHIVPCVLGARVGRGDLADEAVVGVVRPLPEGGVSDRGVVGAWKGLGLVHEFLAAFMGSPSLVDEVALRHAEQSPFGVGVASHHNPIISKPRTCRQLTGASFSP